MGAFRDSTGAFKPWGKGPQGRPRSHGAGRGPLLPAAAAAVGVGDKPDKPAGAAGREREMDRWPFASTAEPGLPRTQPSAILAGGRSRTWPPLPSRERSQSRHPWRKARVGRPPWTCRPAPGRHRLPRLPPLPPLPGISRNLKLHPQPRCPPRPGTLLRRRLRRHGGLLQRRRLQPGARRRKLLLRPGGLPLSRRLEPGDPLLRVRPRIGARPRLPRRPLPRLDSQTPAAPGGPPRWAVLPRLSLPRPRLHRSTHPVSRFPTT